VNGAIVIVAMSEHGSEQVGTGGKGLRAVKSKATRTRETNMPCVLLFTSINTWQMSGTPVHSASWMAAFAGKPFPITVTVRPFGWRFSEGCTARIGCAAGYQ
jgi:hypothetical protein